MAQEKRKSPEKAQGQKPPHGGSWLYDPEKDESTLVQEPTREPEVKEKKPAK